MTDASLAARERARLADLLDEVGPDAPTCCEGWTTAHLAAHLVVRDGRPDALPGFGLSMGIERFAQWPTSIPADWIAVAFGVAAATGVFFGFYPARKAARLDPIEALRFE